MSRPDLIYAFQIAREAERAMRDDRTIPVERRRSAQTFAAAYGGGLRRLGAVA